MRRSAVFLSFFFLLALTVPGFGQKSDASGSKDLPKLFKVNSGLYRGGQPDEKGVKQLAAMGVRSIINLRGENGLSQKEKLWAEESGIRYFNVSMNDWLRPKDKQIDEILSLIGVKENQPAYVHCRRGSDRTGTVIAIYRITHDGWTAKRAKREAKHFGLGWWQVWMKDYISDYYKRTVKEDQEAVQN